MGATSRERSSQRMVSHDKPLAPGLYLVATPIGNLEDITLRALRVLRSVDRIACEDTRQTAKLLGHFGIRTPTVSYHTHNENTRASELIEALKAGGRIAVVSDAGMPGIADPGATIAAEAIAAGVAVYPIPGANAALSALIASGLNAERFAFHGFLPSKEGQRRTSLEALRDTHRAGRRTRHPHRLRDTAPHRRRTRRHRLDLRPGAAHRAGPRAHQAARRVPARHGGGVAGHAARPPVGARRDGPADRRSPRCNRIRRQRRHAHCQPRRRSRKPDEVRRLCPKKMRSSAWRSPAASARARPTASSSGRNPASASGPSGDRSRTGRWSFPGLRCRAPWSRRPLSTAPRSCAARAGDRRSPESPACWS